MAKSAKKKTAARRPKTSGKVTAKGSRKPAGKSKKSRIAKIAAPLVLSDAVVLDRLFTVIESRRDADPTVSHSARLLSRGPAKVAQKFGEEAVECLIEAVAGNRDALIAESADVLYHLLVLWVSSGVAPAEVWAELVRREGISGITEKAARARPVAVRRRVGTSKIP
jgi:phosphoribosyl-ATP pyrophosphohydrolase